tara:strand:- start:3800 stop:4189 length:390 start_codon:yes stop_codon:yes gene_type:complete
MGVTLYERLGGYDAIAAVAKNLVERLQKDSRLAKFWAHRGKDGIARELQLLIDYLCESAGGPLYYTGRDMKRVHAGMGLNQEDWLALRKHLENTLDEFSVPATERQDVLNFIETLKDDIVDSQVVGMAG